MGRPDVASVLVVDDEAEVCELLTDALGGERVRIDTAASGAEALRLARSHPPDLLVADLFLGDCTGLELIDDVRSLSGDVPVVVITGRGDAWTLTEASRRHPVEVLTKPIDVQRLRAAVAGELDRRASDRRLRERTRRLRRLARAAADQRDETRRRLQTTCADLTTAYRTLSSKLATQQVVLRCQNELLAARNDDDVFRSIFRLFAERSGPVFGVALACNAAAQLQIVGRFGVPQPDGLDFCRHVAAPLVDAVLVCPQATLIDAGETPDMFDPSVRRYLAGMSILAVPLLPAEGELIGLVVLYRKGEQPFLDNDVALADMISYPAALAVRRNGQELTGQDI